MFFNCDKYTIFLIFYKIVKDRVAGGCRQPRTPSEPYVTVSRHTAQAFIKVKALPISQLCDLVSHHNAVFRGARAFCASLAKHGYAQFFL